MSDGKSEFTGANGFELILPSPSPYIVSLSLSCFSILAASQFRGKWIGISAKSFPSKLRGFFLFREICFVSRRRPQRLQFGSCAIIVTREINFSWLAERFGPRDYASKVKWISFPLFSFLPLWRIDIRAIARIESFYVRAEGEEEQRDVRIFLASGMYEIVKRAVIEGGYF